VQGHFVIRLEALSPATRMPRVYQLSVDRDLFGSWVVNVAFGRQGCRGRAMQVLADTEQAVRRLLRQRLRRRTVPPGPTGLSYEIREVTGELHWLAPAPAPEKAAPAL
jgi:hypothetical protein